MAAKKIPQTKIEDAKPESENSKFFLKWLFVLGGLIAGVLNALSVNSIIASDTQYQIIVTVLMCVGIIVGVFYFNSDEVINIGLRFLILGAAANSISSFYKVGPYLAPFFLGFAYYLGPIVLALIVVYFVKKYILEK